LRSCLYEGSVVHRRDTPVEHEFRFPLFMVYLDLAELDEVFTGRWLWSTRRAAFARFDRSDHIGQQTETLDESVRAAVEARTGTRPAGPIGLLTHLRYGGFLFNPVSLYYCWDESGERLEAVVADVTNTPWNERHTYVLAAGEPQQGGIRVSTRKEFHVSPFMPMNLGYRWTLGAPGQRLSATIENVDESGRRVFDASLSLARRSIGAASMARALAFYPFMTVQAVLGVYWQALRLFVKRAPFHSHPEVVT
jgi:DUF1365 family protein